MMELVDEFIQNQGMILGDGLGIAPASAMAEKAVFEQDEDGVRAGGVACKNVRSRS